MTELIQRFEEWLELEGISELTYDYSTYEHDRPIWYVKQPEQEVSWTFSEFIASEIKAGRLIIVE